MESQSKTETEPEDICKVINQKLRFIRNLKRQNRIREQQEEVTELKNLYGTYRNISTMSGTPLKTVHSWCCKPTNREHKGTAHASLKREEFTNFLMQDTVSYSHPSKKYAGKKFLMHTWNDIYKLYKQQPEFHKNGLILRTAMRIYKPKHILLSGSTPPNQEHSIK